MFRNAILKNHIPYIPYYIPCVEAKAERQKEKKSHNKAVASEESSGSDSEALPKQSEGSDSSGSDSEAGSRRSSVL